MATPDVNTLLASMSVAQLQELITQKKAQEDAAVKAVEGAISTFLTENASKNIGDALKALEKHADYKKIAALPMSKMFRTTLASAINRTLNQDTLSSVLKAIKASDEPLSTKQIAEDVKMSEQTVRTYLQELVKTNKIVAQGGKKDRKYKLAA